MNQIEALQRLQRLATPAFETRDAAALLRVTPSNANMILRRLAKEGMITHVSHGRWLANSKINRLALPELISAPYPAYVSLQTALFHHGLIEQVPSVIYAITLARPRRVATPMGTVSFHQMPPVLFMGFDLTPQGDAKIATAEKALFDTLYLAPNRSRLFASLPELTIPRGFKWARLREFVVLVKSPSRRTFLEERVKGLRQIGR
jgi:predicted transcriptional regulator of viral defense system